MRSFSRFAEGDLLAPVLRFFATSRSPVSRRPVYFLLVRHVAELIYLFGLLLNVSR
jgi:hypothetical protein